MTQSTHIPHWCQKLRWKSYGRDKDNVSAMLTTFEAGQVVFSCLETAEPFGSDDGPVAPECCNPKRACYKEHQHLTNIRSQSMV